MPRIDTDTRTPEPAIEEVEVLDAEALTGPAVHAAVQTRGSRAVQAARGAAVVAGTGFLAGAAAAVVVGARTRPRRRGRRRGEVLGTRSFLVDVHLLGDR